MKIVLVSMPDVVPLLMHEDVAHLPNLGIASVGEEAFVGGEDVA